MAIIVPDNRYNYGEVRQNAFGENGDVLFCLTFTLRGDDVRAISLRPCRATEVEKWLKR